MRSPPPLLCCLQAIKEIIGPSENIPPADITHSSIESTAADQRSPSVLPQVFGPWSPDLPSPPPLLLFRPSRRL